MKTVRDACQLQPNALSIKLSDQIEQLDELINAEGDGTEFFEKTYITQGMQDRKHISVDPKILPLGVLFLLNNDLLFPLLSQ